MLLESVGNAILYSNLLDTEKVSCTCNTAVVTGGIGGVMGLVIVIQSVLVVVLLVIVLSQCNIKKRAERLVMKGQRSSIQNKNYCICFLALYRRTSSSTEGDHKMVVTSSNAAYGVVSVTEDHQYEVIGPGPQRAQDSSATDPSHQ